MKQLTGTTLCLAMMSIALPALAADLSVTMHKATQDGTGEELGTITIAPASDGATLKLQLHGLPPGAHGFHIHANANCGPTLLNGIRIPAGAAGSHWDPDMSAKHAGPEGEGHLGDLPRIDVGDNGTATQTLTAPRIKDIEALKNHALIIHAGGDTYSDNPNLGGGGGRIACGVIE
ncbi:MAG TPA: superoxide dismutase [Cu-Zn] SodC2 [Acetobacteraceae bacterium]|nr:superoxide dismutase [Cu-Zn] SodC2 [Acetobacteraceae bacterium]